MSNVISNYFKINKQGSFPGSCKERRNSISVERKRKNSVNSSTDSCAQEASHDSISSKISPKITNQIVPDIRNKKLNCQSDNALNVPDIVLDKCQQHDDTTRKTTQNLVDNSKFMESASKTSKTPRKRKISSEKPEVNSGKSVKIIRLTETSQISPANPSEPTIQGKSCGQVQVLPAQTQPVCTSLAKRTLLKPENMEKLNQLKKDLLKIKHGLATPSQLQEKPKISVARSAESSSLTSASSESKNPNEPKVPAYQQYHALAAKDAASSLVLPFKYKFLAEGFRCLDIVVSLMHNRQEMCPFAKVKPSVQDMMRRNFDLHHLGQIKTVFPTAYHFQREKLHINRNFGTESQLTVSPNMDCFSTEINATSNTGVKEAPFTVLKPCGNESVVKNSVDSQRTMVSQHFEKMKPSFLLARRNVFHSNLLKLVDKYHKEFLSKLNPPIVLAPHEILTRWHPSFQVDNVPDVIPSELPLPTETLKYSTAIDVLNRVKGLYSKKIDDALQSVSSRTTSVVNETKKEPTLVNHAPVPAQPIKGIPPSLLEKIRAREAAKIKANMTRNPEADLRLKMLSRLPDIARILRNLFIAEKKAAVCMADVTSKLTESYVGSVTPVEMERHLQLLKELLPDWIKILDIRAGVYLKLNKMADFSGVLAIIENAHKRAALS